MGCSQALAFERHTYGCTLRGFFSVASVYCRAQFCALLHTTTERVAIHTMEAPHLLHCQCCTNAPSSDAACN